MSKNINWETVDWTQQDVSLKSLLNVSQTAIHYHRSRLKKKRSPKWHHRSQNRSETKINWEAADWTKQDVEIAEILGVTRAAVCQKRNELHKGDATHKNRRTSVLKIEQQIITEKASLDGLPFDQIKARFEDIGGVTLRNILKKNGIGWKRANQIYPWDKLNWDLPNRVLEEIWGIKPNMVASRRMKTKKPAAKWDIRFGWHEDNAELNLAITRERLKAVAHNSVFVLPEETA
jgi:hypothetical protein